MFVFHVRLSIAIGNNLFFRSEVPSLPLRKWLHLSSLESHWVHRHGHWHVVEDLGSLLITMDGDWTGISGWEFQDEKQPISRWLKLKSKNLYPFLVDVFLHSFVEQTAFPLYHATEHICCRRLVPCSFLVSGVCSIQHL